MSCKKGRTFQTKSEESCGIPCRKSMREKDLLTRQFLANKTVFADICNIGFHEGRRVIKAEFLRELPSRAEAAPGERGLNSRAIVYERDVVMGCYEPDSDESNPPSLVIALEAQTGEDRAMPFRMAMYEVLEYKGQLDTLRKEASRRSGKGFAFISRLPPGYLLIPVASAVVYFGTRPWKKNTHLKQMLKEPGKVCAEKYIHDYEIYVFSLCAFTDEQLDDCCPELVCAAKALRYGENKYILRKKLQEDPDLARTPSWVVPMINSLLNIKLEIDKEEETTDMCRAAREMIADIKQEGIEEGLERGIVQGREEGLAEGVSKSIRNVAAAMASEKSSPESIVSFLMRAFSLSAEAARTYLV